MQVRNQAAWPTQSPVLPSLGEPMVLVPLQDTPDTTALSSLLGVCPPHATPTSFARRGRQAAAGGRHTPVPGTERATAAGASRQTREAASDYFKERVSSPKAPVPPLMFPAAKKTGSKEAVQVTFLPPKENSRLNAHHCRFSNMGPSHRLCSLLRKAFHSGPQHSQAEF